MHHSLPTLALLLLPMQFASAFWVDVHKANKSVTSTEGARTLLTDGKSLTSLESIEFIKQGFAAPGNVDSPITGELFDPTADGVKRPITVDRDSDMTPEAGVAKLIDDANLITSTIKSSPVGALRTATVSAGLNSVDLLFFDSGAGVSDFNSVPSASKAEVKTRGFKLVPSVVIGATEPSLFALLGAGLITLAYRRGKKRRRASNVTATPPATPSYSHAGVG